MSNVPKRKYLRAAMILSVLTSLFTACHPKAETTLIKEPPCRVAAWPEFPEVYLVNDCPEGLVCITVGDHTAIAVWLNQIERIHDTLKGCVNVKIDELVP